MNATPVARFVTAGGAYVTVTHDIDSSRFAANCGACGFLDAAYYTTGFPSDVQRHMERKANAHASDCRRIPNQFGGAS